MSLDTLPTIITLLIALSVAAERAVEIVKSVVPWLDTAHADTRSEGRRRAALHILAAAAGIAISWLAWPLVGEALAAGPGGAARARHMPTVLALGLLASGGSGFWNALLSYTVSLKELKRTDSRARAAQQRATAIPTPLEGELQP